MLNPRTATKRTSLSGAYMRKTGEQALYTYSGAFGVSSEGVWWLVTVRRQGILKGTPIGTLVEVNGVTKSEICALIERQIEELDQVME
jgi:hypothetical protein